jgi:hypothetical protein
VPSTASHWVVSSKSGVPIGLVERVGVEKWGKYIDKESLLDPTLCTVAHVQHKSFVEWIRWSV